MVAGSPPGATSRQARGAETRASENSPAPGMDPPVLRVRPPSGIMPSLHDCMYTPW